MSVIISELHIIPVRYVSFNNKRSVISTPGSRVSQSQTNKNNTLML